MRMRIVFAAIVVLLLSLAFALGAYAGMAGSLEPTNPPASTSSYTLEDVYDRLDTGAAGAPSMFTEPGSGPGTATGQTLDEVMAKAPKADNTDGALPAEVLGAKTYWGLRTDGTWGLQSGTMPNNGAVAMIPATSNQAIAAGYHNGAGYVAGDADLVAGNVRSGANLFGVAGACRSVPATGQTTSYAAGDDGTYQSGCLPAVSDPSEFHRRIGFEDNSDGTVTDLLTGLIWLKDANCLGVESWPSALSEANGLASGTCGLTDGSSAGDWRVPNINELRSLIDLGESAPALPVGHPFSDVELASYWSSSTVQGQTNYVWTVHLSSGILYKSLRTSSAWVWPVRGGQ